MRIIYGLLALTFACVLLLFFFTQGSPSYPIPAASKCKIFPANNHFNLKIDQLPVADQSNQIINSIGRNDPVHPDFGSGKYNGAPIGIPYTIVRGSQEKVPISFYYQDESDKGPYPIPPDAKIEGGSNSTGDRHIIIVDKDACKLYEIYDAHKKDSGKRWRAGSGATWNLSSNKLRPKGWTSADAAGLPILPGLVRWDEIKRGKINHALRFTAPETRSGAYEFPARHFASSDPDPRLPMMGMRFRLKASVDVSQFTPEVRVVLRALKNYGMFLADNGSPWYISGAPNSHFNNDDFHELHELKGSDFELVDTTSLPKP